MCGIAVAISKPPTDASRRVEIMLKNMEHRGPDAFGQVNFGPVSLGNTQLVIQDQSSRGNQPMTDLSNTWTIVFNGEIFNHHELRKTLNQTTWETNSDTETLLYGLCEKGIPFFSEIDGFFALMAYHHPSRQILMARDRLGIKPLYYAQDHTGFWAASEIKAITASGYVAKVDTPLLRHTLIHRWTNGLATPIQGIKRLSPGAYAWVTIENWSPRVSEWFCLEEWISQDQSTALKQQGSASVRADLEEALVKSVKSRLLSDAPIGTLCSGGLDSSLVTAISQQVSEKEILAFSATFPEQPEADERKFAELVCQSIGVHYIPVVISREDWVKNFVASTVHFGYPLVHESAVALSIIAEKAKALGLKSLLSGEGADELFGGYGSRHLQERMAYQPDLILPDEMSLSSSDDWLPYMGALEVQEPQAYEQSTTSSLTKAFSFLPEKEAYLNAKLAADLRLFLSHGLNRLDKNMMQHSIEIREPFLANAMVKMALNLDLSHKVTPNLKSVLRQVGLNYLPEVIIKRKKVGFSFSCRAFLQEVHPDFLTQGYLRDALEISKKDWLLLCAQLNERSYMRFLSAEVWTRSFLMGEPLSAISLHDKRVINH